ncbi:MAG: EAL domain-containing protein [Natronospirillum sp.]|uniref:EAL domain-containing protein n=1 Tax=Natronospirillum sp. TaxID=2812955 RepID=UPI0025F9E651|nr:EAL domain-containing protein [Natronospirillum sp.]MCH8553164.1 EAL domain-containing protein [Natronospirillum sp.]
MTMIDPKSLVAGLQPIVDIARGTIVGYEVLARRWNADETGLDSLGHLFYGGQIPSRELLELDRLIRRRAIMRIDEVPGDTFISLNISPDWINQLTAWTTTPLLQMLDRAGVDPQQIVLEITEQPGTLGTMKQVVRRYREEGYRVAIDDFGAGSSHMHRIMELEPDILKLDMKLFKNAANQGQHYDLVHGVSRLAEKTGCQLVCEGVETTQEFNFGLELGAAWMQGFLFSPAGIDIHPTNHFRGTIDTLRNRFLTQKLDEHQKYHQVEQQVQAELRSLREYCLTSDPVSFPLPEESLLLRFYICDARGTQLSPNFDVQSGVITADPEPEGVNWCWRPHFYKLLATRRTQDLEFVASGQYRDMQTRLSCRSYATALDGDRYLLVDVLQPDDSAQRLRTVSN